MYVVVCITYIFVQKICIHCKMKKIPLLFFLQKAIVEKCSVGSFLIIIIIFKARALDQYLDFSLKWTSKNTQTFFRNFSPRSIISWGYICITYQNRYTIYQSTCLPEKRLSRMLLFQKRTVKHPHSLLQ